MRNNFTGIEERSVIRKHNVTFLGPALIPATLISYQSNVRDIYFRPTIITTIVT